MTRLEELTPGAVVRGVVPGEAVTVVASRWAGSRSVVLTFRTDAGRVDEQIVYRTQEAELTLDWPGHGVVVRRRWGAVPTGCRGSQDPPRLPLRSAARGSPQPHRAAASSDHRRLRRDAAAAAVALLPRRRSRSRQDDHGGALHQGADAAGRPSPSPDRGARRARRPMAGRAARQVRARLLDPDAGTDRGSANRRPLRRTQLADCATGPPLPQRRPRRAS